MKLRTLILVLICLFVSTLVGQKIDVVKFTPKEAAQYMEEHLRSLDYPFQVYTTLVKGKVVFRFHLETPAKNINDVEDFTWEIVEKVAQVTSVTSWRSDRAIIYFKDKPFYWIYTKDCRAASKVVWGKIEFITAHLHYFKK